MSLAPAANVSERGHRGTYRETQEQEGWDQGRDRPLLEDPTRQACGVADDQAQELTSSSACELLSDSPRSPRYPDHIALFHTGSSRCEDLGLPRDFSRGQVPPPGRHKRRSQAQARPLLAWSVTRRSRDTRAVAARAIDLQVFDPGVFSSTTPPLVVSGCTQIVHSSRLARPFLPALPKPSRVVRGKRPEPSWRCL